MTIKICFAVYYTNLKLQVISEGTLFTRDNLCRLKKFNWCACYKKANWSHYFSLPPFDFRDSSARNLVPGIWSKSNFILNKSW